MDTPRDVLDYTVTHDLFGPNALSEPAGLDLPDKYTLQECLGRGGCGLVYAAEDRVLGRRVAVKFLTEARRADVERFRREARFAARLSDPAIVTVYEFGENWDPPYIAMQYVDGGNLAAVGWSPAQIVRAAVTVARALQHAHEEGIVHRDIKPANILVDKAGRVYVSDFGVARDLLAHDGATISRDGALLGTPALMAPEQARGQLEAIDARTDIYALGATLYTLLTGRHPFERSNLADLLHAIVHEEPPLPRSLRPELPRALESIILQCLRKSRSDRFASMAALAEELEAWLQQRPVSGEQNEWFRRLVGAPRPTEPTPSDSDSLQTLGMEIAGELAHWDANLYRVSRNLSRHYPTLDNVLARLDALLASRPHLAWARFHRGMARLRRGQFEAALEDMERSIDRLPARASAQFELGRLYLTLYLQEHRRARAHFSTTGTDFHLDEARARLRQAEVCFDEAQRLKQDLRAWQVDFARAVRRLADRDYERCVTECDRILENDPDVEDVWKLRGDALRFAGRPPFESYRRAIDVRRSDWQAWIAMAEAHFEQGASAEAHNCLEQALEIVPDHPEVLTRLARLRLAAARAATGPDVERLLLDGLRLAERSAAATEASYDTQVTLAELQLELAAARRSPEPLAAVLASLQRAETLPGCQNRVGYLNARALVLRAGFAPSGPAAARADLENAQRLACGPATHVPDGAPWRDLAAHVEAELARMRAS